MTAEKSLALTEPLIYSNLLDLPLTAHAKVCLRSVGARYSLLQAAAGPAGRGRIGCDRGDSTKMRRWREVGGVWPRERRWNK